jgi:hypothetical protein
LEPGIGIVHGGSEFFRPQNGHDQVDQEREGEEADKDDFHVGQGGWVGSAGFFAEKNVGGAKDEKCHGKGDKDEIVHGGDVGCLVTR